MNTGKIVFSQVMEFLPLHEFRKCVKRYKGNYKVQSFSCMDQSLCMAFAQNISSQINIILQIFSMTAFEKIELSRLLNDSDNNLLNTENHNQLQLFT